ncbi:hypothetical protein midi_00487 [Candidatus Midichloria mitochondrii IricVA]|uniref:Uncharacterized protein n=1 Tax=Midichloria mitochondrii (strain IricVA) TaxID=696127 RepID=F7XVU5_MIDMI|nr:hypothetical protein midi_00487 [Candidatus Midichloria mitochondrii IricVA]
MVVFCIKFDTSFEVKAALLAIFLNYSILTYAIRLSSFVSLYMYSLER